MSQKYKLTEDTDDDSPSASIKRHLRMAVLIFAVPIVALIVLVIISLSASARESAIQEAELQAAIATQAALPTRTPRPTATPLPPPTVLRDTSLRTGPALRFDAIRTLNAGELVTLVGIDQTGTWYMLDNGFWVAAITIGGDIPELPIEP